MTKKTVEQQEIQNLSVDFTEVEFTTVDPTLAKIIRGNYEELPATQALLRGEVLKVPINTNTERIYQWFYKRDYLLRKKSLDNSLIIWVEPRVKKDTAEK